MYGKGDTGFPQRLVCLSSEHVEICYALGAGGRVVGVPGTAHRPPEARGKQEDAVGRMGGERDRIEREPTGRRPSNYVRSAGPGAGRSAARSDGPGCPGRRSGRPADHA